MLKGESALDGAAGRGEIGGVESAVRVVKGVGEKLSAKLYNFQSNFAAR